MQVVALLLLFISCWAVVDASGPLHLPTTTSVRATPRRQITKRALESGTVCATVDVKARLLILTRTVIDDICLCTKRGALTVQSQSDLQTAINQLGDGGLIGGLLELLGGSRANLNAMLVSNAQSTVAAKRPTCDYPTNSIPMCGGATSTCAFTCAANTKRCGNQCIALERSCVSGIPAANRKRNFRCPGTQTFCPIIVGKKTTYECVDTLSELESCGGCAGSGQGMDCSEIAGADDVMCMEGTCLVKGCSAGWVLVGNSCEPDLSYNQKKYRLE